MLIILFLLQIWLNTLLDTMKETIKNVIANIAQTMTGDPDFEFLVGFWNFPGQVLIITYNVPVSKCVCLSGYV